MADPGLVNRPLLPDGAAGLPNSNLSLLDLADRLLNRGVVVAGDATISVAGIDRVYLGLNLVLASVETLRATPSPDKQSAQMPAGTPPGWRREECAQSLGPRFPAAGPQDSGHVASPPPNPASPAASPSPAQSVPGRVANLDLDPDRMEEGLARLVLTLVELIRQLLERQAIRRMEGGSLSEAEVERLGLALLRLQEKLHEMAAAFGLQPEELNINLGPLGNLL